MTSLYPNSNSPLTPCSPHPTPSHPADLFLWVRHALVRSLLNKWQQVGSPRDVAGGASRVDGALSMIDTTLKIRTECFFIYFLRLFSGFTLTKDRESECSGSVSLFGCKEGGGASLNFSYQISAV